MTGKRSWVPPVIIVLIVLAVLCVSKILPPPKFDEPKIAGPAEFQEDIQAALNLLAEASPEHYELVVRNIREVRLGDNSELSVTAKIFVFGKEDWQDRKNWRPGCKRLIACALIHEAWHVRQHYGARPGEREAIAKEREFLLLLGDQELAALMERIAERGGR